MAVTASGRFVILEHDREGVHWDLMLEVDGSLRTWTLHRPIEPNRPQTARELPPHRLVYLDYEGPISGDRGTVSRWDSGQFLATEWSERRIVIELSGNYVRGEAELLLEVDGADRPREGWLFRWRGKVDRST